MNEDRLILNNNICCFYWSGLDLTLVFTNHILAENTFFTNHIKQTEHKIMVLRHANRYQIIQQCHNFKNILINNFQYGPWSKSFVIIIFYRA